jgi:hypothetical protein
MPTSTTNYELIKPGTDDPILIEQLNTNADIIDNALKENADALGGKVDKETGKGLSTNDFTTAEKTKLDDLAEIKSIGTGLNLDDNGELTATGGGSGGTTNYNDLSNKPQINGNTLSGNKTSAQLGLASASDIPTVPITAIQKNGTGITPVSGTVNITVPTTAADVSALPASTKYAAALSLTINSSTFVMTGQLKDQNGDNLGTAQTIDLPLESVVVGGSYNSQTKKVVLTLQNGNTIEFSVADLVSGLQTELSASNKLNPTYINYDSTHRAVSDTEKSTWNGKQNALSSTQLDAVNSGIDSTKVEQIETNKNNISKDEAALVELVDGGAKNILQIGTAVTVEKNGVTAVSNTDGSVTISGVSTSGSQFLIINDLYSGSTTSTYSSQIPIKAGNYVVKATGTRDVLIQAINYNSSTDTEVIDSSNDDVEFTATKSYIVFRLVIRGNTDFTTPVTIYPMCCDSALYAISPKSVPYRPSYQELYEMVKALQANQ